MLRNLSRFLLVLGAAVLATAPGLSAQTGGQPVRGDVDGDGRVTAADARIVADYLVGRTVPAGIDVAARGDVNGDGRVTAADAAIINAYAAGRENAKRFPVGTPITTVPNPDGLAAFVCGADVRARTVTCEAPKNGNVRGATIGGQHENVEIASSNIASTLNGSTYDFSFDVTLKNLVPQKLGTEDGLTADSIHVFFFTPPTADAGTGQITVDSAGIGTFTASNQTYYSYPGLLADSATTPVRRWFFKIPDSVTHFQFLLYVDAKLQFPSGWVDIYPPTHAPSPYLVPTNTLAAGATLQLEDTVRNHLGHVVTGQAVTWSITGHGAATVNASTGLVTAGAPGVDTVTATSGSRTGRVEIVVTAGAPASMIKKPGHDSTTVVAGNNVPADSLPTVKVTDSGGHPVPNVAVTFTLSPDSGSLANGSSTGSFVIDSTDAAGEASVTGWTLVHTAGVYNVIASSPGLTDVTFTSTVKHGAPASMAKVPGHDNASAVVNTGVHADSLPSVLVTDTYGNPVPGVGVTFAVASGGGSVTGGSQTTNASGIATVGSWTVGTTAGANTVNATSAGLSTLTFTATGRPGDPANIEKTAGDLQTGTAGSPVAIPPAVHVTDAFNNDVPGATINFTVIGGGGSTTVASPTTDAFGKAAVGSWTLGSGPTTNQLQAAAAVGTAAPDTFTAYIPPVAATDLSQAMGNQLLPSSFVPNVLANDVTINGGSLTVTTLDSLTTARNGRVIITAAGAATFVPAAGVTGRDSVQYTINDGHVSASGWLKFAFIGKVWHVDQSYAGAAGAADGRDFRPFTSISAAEAVAGLNDTILVHTGGGLTTGGTLKNGQTLRGQGHTAPFTATINGQSLTLLPMGVAPQVGGLTLGNGNTLRGFRVVNASGFGLTGASIGTLSLGELAINATGGPALDITGGTVVGIGGTGAAVLDSVRSTNSTSSGIALTNVGGTLTINGGTASAITNPTGAAVSISGSNPTFNFPGAISKTNGAGTGINLSGMTGGSASFTGPSIALTTGSGTAINLSSVSGPVTFSSPSVVLSTGSGAGVNMSSVTGTVSFVDSVKVTTGSGNGISATGGGTLTIAGTHNSISSTGGIALNVSGTTIGGTGLNFRSISANGGSNGIVLSSTGAGGLTVSGSGTTGSGGTISNTTGADGAVAGNGIYLSNAQNVSLSWMALNNHGNHAIYGSSVTGFTMNKTRITGTNGSSTATDDGSVSFDNLLGSASITNSYVDGGFEDNVRVVNNTGTLNRLVMTSDTVGFNGTSGNDGVNIAGFSSAVVNATVQNSRFTGSRANNISYVMNESSSGDVLISGNTLTNTHPNKLGSDFGIYVAHASTGAVTYSVTANSVNGAGGSGIEVDRGAGGTGAMTGSITNNTVGTAGVSNSGSSGGSAIFVGLVSTTETATHTTTITGNTVRQFTNYGLRIVNRGATASYLNASVKSNNVAEPSPNAATGLFPTSGIRFELGNVTGDTGKSCLDVASNVINQTGTNGGVELRIFGRFLTKTALPGLGLAGASSDPNTFLNSKNTITVPAGGTAVNATSTNAFQSTCPPA